MLVAGGQSPESGLVALPDDEATAVTKLVTHDDFLHRPHILRLTATTSTPAQPPFRRPAPGLCRIVFSADTARSSLWPGL